MHNFHPKIDLFTKNANLFRVTLGLFRVRVSRVRVRGRGRVSVRVRFVQIQQKR